MIVNSKILTCLEGLVGFEEEIGYDWNHPAPQSDPPADPPIVDPPIFNTFSGLCFQDAHKLVGFENLRAISPPGLNDIDFKSWLLQQVEASTRTVFATIYQRKRLDRIFHTFIQEMYLYLGSGSLVNTEVAQSRFVGFQIMMKKTEGIRVIINKIGTQFTQTKSALNLYLYHTSSSTYIAQIPVTISVRNKFEWRAVKDKILDYAGETTDVGGAWYIGYYEDDLTSGMQALNKDEFNWITGGCASCGSSLEYNNWKSWSSILSIQPISVDNQYLHSDKSLWDIKQNKYWNYGKTWGLNLNISIGCDMTSLVCRNPQMFANLIKLQFAVDTIEALAFSTTTNRLSDIVQKKALYELDDRPDGGQGLRSALRDEYEATSIDFSGLDRICLPCEKNKIEWRSVS